MQCVCFASALGVAEWEGVVEWVGGLGLVFTNPVGTGGVWGMCLGLGCGDMGGVGRVDG